MQCKISINRDLDYRGEGVYARLSTSIPTFIESLPKMPLEERVQVFRHEALRAVHHAKGFSELIQKETEDCANLPDYVDEYFELVSRKLGEILHLTNALVVQVDDS